MNSFYNNYKFVREDSEKEFSFSHLIDTDGFTMDFHSHNFIEVYLSVSGGDHFIIDNKIYEIEPGDLFVSNPNEVHRVIAKENEVYERYVFEFKPTFILPYCTKNTDLLHYVYRREDGFSNKISLNTADHKTFLLLIEKYETLSDTDYGNDVLRELYYELISQIMEHNHLPKNEQEIILNHISDERCRIEQIMSHDKFTEEISFLDENEFRKTPVTLSLSAAFYEIDVYYTYDEYLKHLDYSKAYADAHDNYELKLLPEPVFTNIQITLHEGKWAVVSKGKSPCIHFMIFHPKMRSAIENMVVPIIEE